MDIDRVWGALLLSLLLGGAVIALAMWLNRGEHIVNLLARLGNLSFFGNYKKYRRAQLLAESFPSTWVEVLRRNVALYHLLTPEEQEKLHDDLRIFLAEKHWEGCRGLTVTTEMQVTISAQACILLLGLEHDYFSHVPSILIYPTTFRTQQKQLLNPEGGVAVLEGQVATLGQASYRGPVILAWDEVLAGGRDAQDGRNVVYHEFAHQLDFLGELGGLTRQARRGDQFRQWQTVMHEEYEQLVRAARMGRATLLDPYGATNPTEFFAVATEYFFELPLEIRQYHPRLYEVLRDFYGQDTANRMQKLERRSQNGK